MTKLDEREIIHRIWYFRDKAKISGRDLSLTLGKSENYIKKLECHDFGLTTKMLCEILDALHITPEQFFSPDYQNYDMNNELSQIIDGIPAPEREALLKYLRIVYHLDQNQELRVMSINSRK